MTNTAWQPTASLKNLQQRAKLLASIRLFFQQRHVLEVETPLLGRYAVTDPYMEALRTDNPLGKNEPFYLQTSPEYAMKRLLAAGSGPIYQISKAFRKAERGYHHNPEFTMLEWYRPGFDHHQLMDEVADLMQVLIGSGHCRRMRYHDLFQHHFELDPHTASRDTLQRIARQHIDVQMDSNDCDDWLNVLLTEKIEPTLGWDAPLFIYDYPASQAALATIEQDETGTLVAQRFELYYHGVELANGYHELTEANEQRRRFIADQQKRKANKQPHRAIDAYLLSAMISSLPPCAGVALGIDRLLMALLNTDSIANVMAFPVDRA